jgi:hypothetical protein
MPDQYDSTGFQPALHHRRSPAAPRRAHLSRPDGLARIPGAPPGRTPPTGTSWISRISALGTGPVTPDYPGKHQLRGISLEHIRRDRILQEALAARADPLHLALIFNIDHTNAMAYASAARNLLSGPAGQALLPFARNEHEGAARGEHIEIEKAYRPLTTGSWGR